MWELSDMSDAFWVAFFGGMCCLASQVLSYREKMAALRAATASSIAATETARNLAAAQAVKDAQAQAVIRPRPGEVALPIPD